MEHSLLVFATIFFVSAVTPGPDTMLLLSRAIDTGVRSAFAYALGIAIAKLVMLSVAVAGATVAAAKLGPLLVAVKFAGASYLVYLGIKLWKRNTTEVAVGQNSPKSSAVKETAAGLVLGLSNPQAILFYLAIVPTVIGVKRANFGEYLILALTLLLVFGVVVAIYLGAAHQARSALQNPSTRKVMNRTLGFLLVLAGAIVATR